jgi:hypothetical protein
MLNVKVALNCFHVIELGKCGRKVLRRLCVHGWQLSTSSLICRPNSIRSLHCRSHVMVTLNINVWWWVDCVSYCSGLAPPPRNVTDRQPSGRSYDRVDKCTDQQVLFFHLMTETSPFSLNVCLHSQNQTVRCSVCHFDILLYIIGMFWQKTTSRMFTLFI